MLDTLNLIFETLKSNFSWLNLLNSGLVVLSLVFVRDSVRTFFAQKDTNNALNKLGEGKFVSQDLFDTLPALLNTQMNLSQKRLDVLCFSMAVTALALAFVPDPAGSYIAVTITAVSVAFASHVARVNNQISNKLKQKKVYCPSEDK